jgi:hypothetical protein
MMLMLVIKTKTLRQKSINRQMRKLSWSCKRSSSLVVYSSSLSQLLVREKLHEKTIPHMIKQKKTPVISWRYLWIIAQLLQLLDMATSRLKFIYCQSCVRGICNLFYINVTCPESHLKPHPRNSWGRIAHLSTAAQ